MPYIPSEMIEPALTAMIGEYFAELQRSEKTLDDYKKFWHRISTLDTLTVYTDSTHATIAMSNHMRQVANFIQDETGQDCSRW